MFYKQRKMDAENQLFFRRVGRLPLVKAASDQLISYYEMVKNCNRLVNATLEFAENGVKSASEAEIVKKVLDNQLVGLVNQLAVKQLDKVEHDYPIVRTTPDQLWKSSKNYYDHSRVKSALDKVNSVKEYSVDKISGTKKYYQDLVSGKLNGFLDLSDSLVDKYISVHTEVNGQPAHCNKNAAYFARIQCISGKLYYGLKHRAGENFEVTKQYVLQTLGDLHVAMVLIDYAKNSYAWGYQKGHDTLTAAQERAKALWIDIQHRVEPISNKSQAIVLSLVQSLANNVAGLSDYLAKMSSPYLPEGVDKTVTAGAAYAIELRDTFAKAKSVGDLRDEVISEAKRKYVVVQEALMKAIDYLIEFPPACWLIPHEKRANAIRADGSTHEATENGHVDKKDD